MGSREGSGPSSYLLICYTSAHTWNLDTSATPFVFGLGSANTTLQESEDHTSVSTCGFPAAHCPLTFSLPSPAEHSLAWPGMALHGLAQPRMAHKFSLGYWTATTPPKSCLLNVLSWHAQRMKAHTEWCGRKPHLATNTHGKKEVAILENRTNSPEFLNDIS